ncbi:MAG: ArsI/CadI family heavy metal resistance metalloenzyme [Bacteroidota bacterium]
MENQNKFHIGIHVSNIRETINFYQHLFGTEPVKIKRDYAKFELDNPGLVISFIESPEQVSNQFGHLGIRVNSDEELQSKKKEVSEYLKITLEEEATNCCYATQNKFWVSDPDGYEWEVYHFLKDSEAKERNSVVACC